MGGDGDDDTLVSELADGSAGKGAVDAETVNENRGGDELVGGNLLHQLVVGGLVEDDGVVGLILNLSLGPLLLIFRDKQMETCVSFLLVICRREGALANLIV